jgi:hydrogenase expression/formation protein HypD
MTAADPAAAADSQRLLDQIRRGAQAVSRNLRYMEVCGTHTMAIHRAGLPGLLPKNIRLLSGPGCPVCVTPMGYLDAALELARRPGTTLTTFGDMMRVPGASGSLDLERASGADVRIVYSPIEAVRLAGQSPRRNVVFLAVGFETTAPGTALALAEAERKGIRNFFALCAHKIIPPALAALLADKEAALDGLILPGHVSAILGLEPYRFIAAEYGRAGVITGFEPEDVLQALLMLLRQAVAGEAKVENQYPRVVRPEGNPAARALLERYFERCDAEWRGLGTIPASGLQLRPEFASRDAATALGVEIGRGVEPAGCLCGEVLRGRIEPEACPLFAEQCTPMTPVGACMVSSEGTCAAHYKYSRRV